MYRLRCRSSLTLRYVPTKQDLLTLAKKTSVKSSKIYVHLKVKRKVLLEAT